MIEAVIFDVDGTLIDSNDLHAAAWREAFAHFGCDIPYARVRGQIGKGGDNLIPALLPAALVAARQAEIETYRAELFERDYMARVAPFPGVRPLFERLAADGRKIVLASSAKADELDLYAALIECTDLIDATISADDVENSKPDPDIFEAALARVAPLSGGQAVVIGDTPYDAEAAARAGIGMVGVRCGGFPESALLAAGARAIYDDPADLLRNYQGWAPTRSQSD